MYSLHSSNNGIARESLGPIGTYNLTGAFTAFRPLQKLQNSLLIKRCYLINAQSPTLHNSKNLLAIVHFQPQKSKKR